MEKSDSKTSVKHESGDENEEQPPPKGEEEQPTTSLRANACSPMPVKISHNMNDLKCLDFNSADEIRQAMKAILANCKIPPPAFTEEPMHFEPKTTQQNQSQKPVTIPESVQNQPIPEVDGHKNESSNNKKPQAKTNARSITRPWTFKPLAPQDSKTPSRNTVRPWIFKPIAMFRRNTKRGRPPKAGPSKKVKKSNASSMYAGKLSNVVPFRRRRANVSDSDSDGSAGMCY